MADPKTLAIEAGASLAGQALGMATAGWQDRRQLKQQRKLQQLQIEGQQKMSNYEQQLALDMWEKTNYEAQRKQLEKAGLNIGLMYAGGGQGGTTHGAGSGNVTGAHAPTGGGELGMGMQLGLQAAMQQATIELTKAQTEKTKAETQKTGGVDTQQTIAATENLKQATDNAKLQGQFQIYQNTLAQIQTRIQTATEQDIVDTVKNANNKLAGEAESARNAGRLSTESYTELQKQIVQTTLEQAGRLAIQKVTIPNIQANTAETNAKINRMAQEIWQIYNNANNENRRINQKDTELMLQKTMTEFNTNDSQHVKQIVDIWKQVIDGISGAIKAFK